MKAYGEVSEKALSTGQRADAAAACVRMGFFHGDKRCVIVFICSRCGGLHWASARGVSSEFAALPFFIPPPPTIP